MEPATTGARRIPATRVNLLANYLGRISNGVCSVLFIPLYVKFLGIEAFGLVGFYTSLIGVLAIFDLGMNATITRELTNTDVDEQYARRSNDLVRTLGSIYWLIGGSIASVVALSAGWLAKNWLNASALSDTTVEHAIVLMGITLAGQMLLGFYSSGLFGLQRHVACNIIVTSVTALRTAGVTLVLWLVSPTITTFFVWQAISVFAGLGAVTLVMRHYLPRGRGRFRFDLLREVWRFAAGAFTASTSGMLLYQTDKIVLSRMLPLKQFGYYALAVSAASALQYLSSPIFTTFFPSFSRKVAMRSERELVAQYHRASQVLAVAIIPAGLMLVFFSRPLVIAWTGSPDLAANASPLISVLGLGMTFYAMTPLTYGLQLAHGWTKLQVFANLAMFAVLVPLLLAVVPVYGAKGAAASWMVVSGLYLAGIVWVMHSRILIGERMRWCVHDLLPAAAIVLVLGVAIRVLVPTPSSRLWDLIWIGAVYALLLTAAAVATHETRTYALHLCRKLLLGGDPRVAAVSRRVIGFTSAFATKSRSKKI